MKHILIILYLLFLSSHLFGQTERPETIVIPVGTLGDISDSRKQIIQNTLSQELTKYFRLVPQDKFEAAQEQAFEELKTGYTSGGLDGNTNFGAYDIFLVKYNSDGVLQ